MPNDVAQLLQSAHQRGRLSHAVILQGSDPERIGEVAANLTGYLLGVSPTADPLQHPDCFRVRPANKMRQIPVDAVRRLIRSLAHTSSAGGTKVAVIEHAERMNGEAANALLKTLEEPPSGTYLVLGSTRPQDFLDTIRSRCLNVRVGGIVAPFDDPEWRQWLQRLHAWLDELETPMKSRPDVSSRLFGAYGLIRTFTGIEGRLANAEWETISGELDGETPDDARAAMEAGASRGVRQRLLGEISEALLERSRTDLAADPASDNATVATARLSRACAALENTSRLLQLNLTPVAALESFFLATLRIWSSRKD